MKTFAPPHLVAHVVHRFGTGGLENGIVNLVDRLPRERWRHAIVALTDVEPRFAERIERDDVRVIALDKKPGHLIGEYPRLYGLFRELRPVIVHTRNLAALEAVVPARIVGVPARIHGEHGWDVHDPDGSRVRYRTLRRIYRPFVSSYVAVSRHLERYLVERVGVPAEQVRQIYNGVDAGRFRPAATRERSPDCPFRDPAHWIVGTVGRLEAIKDPLNLVRAFVSAVERDRQGTRDLRLAIVGDGAQRRDVETLLDAHRLRERAWLPGMRSDVAAVMRDFDCFVLPSRAEGISNTILEAMASGLPIVATNVGGNAELVDSGTTGTLVPARDEVALAAGIVGYHVDRERAHRHGISARRAVEQRFSLERMAADYAAVYERAIAERTGSRRKPSDTAAAHAAAGAADQLTDPGR